MPEYVAYLDRGCAYGGPSCLRCPLPECVEDFSYEKKLAWINRQKVLEYLQKSGLTYEVLEAKTPKQIAQEHDVAERTVSRWKKLLRSETPS